MGLHADLGLHADANGRLRIQKCRLRPFVERALAVKAAEIAGLRLEMAATSCAVTRFMIDNQISELEFGSLVIAALVTIPDKDGSVPITSRLLRKLEAEGSRVAGVIVELAAAQ